MNLKICIEQILGMSFQTVPVAILFFSLFWKNKLVYGKKNSMKILFFFWLVTTAGMLAVIEACDYFHVSKWKMCTNLYMLLVIFLFIGLASKMIRENLQKIGLVLIVTIYYATVVYTFNCNLMDVLPLLLQYDEIFVPYDANTVGGLAVTSALVFPIAFYFMQRVVKKSLDSIEGRMIQHGYKCMILSLLIYSVLVSLQSLEQISVKTLLIIIGICIGMGLTYYMYFSQIQLFAQQKYLEEQIENFDIQYRQISQNIEDAKRARHDLKHHFNMLSALCSQNKIEEIKQYLEKYGSEIKKLEDEKLCDYQAVDILMKYYSEKAAKEQIELWMSLKLAHSYPFSLGDMAVLLGNCMDNAMEECRKVTKAPYIRVLMRQQNNVVLIYIENSSQSAKKMDRRTDAGYRNFISTKSGEGHGIGLKSVSQIAKKYNGSAEFKEENGKFITRILLTIPDSDR